MQDQQASIEGQVLVKATAEIIAAANFPKTETLDKAIDQVFDKLAEKLESYKKKEETK
jgi:hypothetical protein